MTHKAGHRAGTPLYTPNDYPSLFDELAPIEINPMAPKVVDPLSPSVQFNGGGGLSRGILKAIKNKMEMLKAEKSRAESKTKTPTKLSTDPELPSFNPDKTFSLNLERVVNDFWAEKARQQARSLERDADLRPTSPDHPLAALERPSATNYTNPTPSTSSPTTPAPSPSTERFVRENVDLFWQPDPVRTTQRYGDAPPDPGDVDPADYGLPSRGAAPGSYGYGDGADQLLAERIAQAHARTPGQPTGTPSRDPQTLNPDPTPPTTPTTPPPSGDRAPDPGDRQTPPSTTGGYGPPNPPADTGRADPDNDGNEGDEGDEGGSYDDAPQRAAAEQAARDRAAAEEKAQRDAVRDAARARAEANDGDEGNEDDEGEVWRMAA